MKIAVLADSHDRIESMRKAIEQVAGEAELLIHCGDYCAPFMLRELARFTGEIHGVFGNVDGDIYLLMKFAQEIPNLELHQPLGEIEVEGVGTIRNPVASAAVPAHGEGRQHASRGLE